MVGNTESGRKPGFKHSESTRRQISESLQGVKKTPEHRERIAQAKSLYDLDGRCYRRYQEMAKEYPEESEFFEENMSELIFAMQDTLSERELNNIRRFHETANLRHDEPYQYPSTSCFAVEDIMIKLLDFKRELAASTLH